MTIKDIILKVLEAAGLNSKATMILKIMALVCGVGAWAADSILENEKNEKMIEKAVTEKLAELAEKGVINLTIKQQ